MSDNVESFLSASEEQEIISAIRKAEQNTSGEIRVHIEHTASLAHYDRAKEIFAALKMYNTQQRNAVLLYIAVKDHAFVIFGDKGIDEVVTKDFWDTTRDVIQEHFKKGDFKSGIVKGVLKAGEELKAHFPWHTGDSDELSNEISKG